MTFPFTRRSSASTAEPGQSGDDESPLFSRSGGLLSGSGNCDSELKTRVSDEAGDDFRRKARERGMSSSELLRLLVLIHVYGADGVAMMTARQIADVAGVGTEKAL